MHGIRLLRPAPQLRGCVRFYAQREVKIQGPAKVFPVPARAAPLLEFVFSDRFEVSTERNRSQKQRLAPLSWGRRPIAAFSYGCKGQSSVS